MKEFFRLLFRGDWNGLFRAPTGSVIVQLFRYCFVGGGSFLIDFAVYGLLLYLGMPYLWAGCLGFVLGFAFNFTASRLWIFRGAAAVGRGGELTAVLLISLVGLGLTELLLYVFVSALGLHELAAKAVAAALVLLWNFWARKRFIYKKKGADEDA